MTQVGASHVCILSAVRDAGIDFVSVLMTCVIRYDHLRGASGTPDVELNFLTPYPSTEDQAIKLGYTVTVVGGAGYIA